MKLGGQQTINTLMSRTREVAESWLQKAELIKEEAFLIPLKGVDKRAEEEGGGMWKQITEGDI
jgi:hypothetical protein